MEGRKQETCPLLQLSDGSSSVICPLLCPHSELRGRDCRRVTGAPSDFVVGVVDGSLLMHFCHLHSFVSCVNSIQKKQPQLHTCASSCFSVTAAWAYQSAQVSSQWASRERQHSQNFSNELSLVVGAELFNSWLYYNRSGPAGCL